MDERSACIVGAGIGGLAAAVALRRAGWSVKVYEREKAPRELGFALLLAPNAMAALRQLGLADGVRKAGHSGKRGEIRRFDGRTLRQFDTAPVEAALGEPTVVALRPVLHGALLEAVGADALVLGNPAVGCEARDGSAELVLADGSRVSARVLIGADGVGSVIRRALHPAEAPARPSGLLSFRGVAHGQGPSLGDLAGAQYFGAGLEAGLARANDEVVYWFLSLRADLAPEGTGEPRALLERLTANLHAPFRKMVLATQPEDLRLDTLLERDPLPFWGTGAVTLLGDAAHPMLPHAGQGAAQALEDAVALGRALAVDRSPEASLRRYEQVRAERTGKVVALAKRNSRVGAMTNPVGVWLRDTAMTLIPAQVLLRSMIAVGKPPPVEA